MKTTNLFFMAALALMTTACSSIDDDIQNPDNGKGIPFTATISLDKSSTRALTESAGDIEATWADGEQVALIYDAGGTATKTDATVTKQDDGTATISATLAGSATDGSDVTIIYPATAADGTTGNVKADALAAQNGTLTGTNSIAAKYDVRTGTGKLSISAGGATVNNGTAGTPVSLTNQVAIFKFTTQNAISTAISVTSLTVVIGTQQYVITPDEATSTLYAALPAVTTAQTVVFSAAGSDGKNYFFAKDGVTYAASQYYQSPLTMTQGVHLAALTGNYVAQDGDVLTGTLGANVQISIAAGASVTLDGVTINGVNGSCTWAGITCNGNATIILKDDTTNSVTGFKEDYPGIQAGPSGTTLTITGETAGTGTLTASSNGYGAGIGGGYSISCGNIEIQGGAITATGGTNAAGIGGGTDICGNITISGGTINATGGSNGAGIGSGTGECGTITIANTVTSVTATAGSDANSIGAGGDGGSCGTVTIGGVVGAITTSPYTYDPSVIPGLLSGKFSVSATQTVQFSQGNLQYQASTDTWRFAEHQYDYVGNASMGNVYVGSTKSNNASISQTYTGWIDFFGWGTSGKTFASGYGTAYQPWATSSTNTDYGPTDGASGLTGTYANGDWGVNMGTGWRTLTSAEWSYLFIDRTTGGTVFGTAQARYTEATINTDGTGVNGIILFPDGVDIASDEVTTVGTVNSGSAWTTKCTTAQWAALDAKGCVFLPAAGYRQGTSVSLVSSYGSYWSSTPNGSSNACGLGFSGANVTPAGYYNRYYGISVRLVQDVAP